MVDYWQMIVDDACDLRKNAKKNKGEFSSKPPIVSTILDA